MATRAEILQKSRQIKRRRQTRFYGLCFFSILVLFGLFVYLAHLPALRIQSVVVDGKDQSSNQEIKQAVEKFLWPSGFSLWPKDNRLFYSRSNLSDYLKKQFPRLDKISLNQSGGVLTVGSSEYEASLLWCLLLSNQAKECFFLNKNGKALARAPEFGDSVFFELRQISGTTTNSDTLVGQVVMSPTDITKILNLRDTINKVFPQTILARSIINGGEVNTLGYSFDVDSPIGSEAHRWRLLVSSSVDSANIASALTAVITSSSFGTRLGGSIERLEYIDARLPGKIFFKVKDHVTSAP